MRILFLSESLMFANRTRKFWLCDKFVKPLSSHTVACQTMHHQVCVMCTIIRSLLLILTDSSPGIFRNFRLFNLVTFCEIFHWLSHVLFYLPHNLFAINRRCSLRWKLKWVSCECRVRIRDAIPWNRSPWTARNFQVNTCNIGKFMFVVFISVENFVGKYAFLT